MIDEMSGRIDPKRGKHRRRHVLRTGRLRLRIGLAGVVPLAVSFALMVYKPDIPAAAAWFR